MAAAPSPIPRHCLALLLAAALPGLPLPAQAGNIRWQTLQLPDVPGQLAGQGLSVRALNNAGQVVGHTFSALDSSMLPFLYTGTQMLALAGPSGAQGQWLPTALSDPLGPSGSVYIAGAALDANGLFTAQGFVQQASTFAVPQAGPVQALVVPGSIDSTVRGVNQSGDVVGTYYLPRSLPRGFSANLDSGVITLQDLNARGTTVNAINNAGLAVGAVPHSNLVRHAAVWNARTGALLDIGTLPGGGQSMAHAVNEQGTVVGESSVAPGLDSPRHAFIHRGGVMSRIADGLETTGNSVAWSINNRGQTLGSFSTGASGGFFLHTDAGGAVSLAGLGLEDGVPGGRIQINDDGQILTGYALHNPTGTLSWAQTAGGRVADVANWDSGMGFAPNRFLDVVIGSARNQTVRADTSFSAKSLRVSASLLGQTTLELSGGATVNALDGVVLEPGGRLQGQGRVLGPTVINRGVVVAVPGQLLVLEGGLDNRGLVTGNGRIEANLINRGGGADGVQVGAGQHLTMAGTGHSAADASRIGIRDGGTLAFEGSLTHQGGAVLRIERGTLQLGYGAQRMANAGQVLVGSGRAEILGHVLNGPRGLVHAHDGADLTVWDALVNDGEVRASGGARIVYAGLVTGRGSFTGLDGVHRFEGGYSPGASPAEVNLGDAQFASLLTMELGGTTPGSQHDQIHFTGSVRFEETSFLQISLINGYQPQAGDRLMLFSYAQAPVGNFEDFLLPSLAGGLVWDVSQLHTTGALAVAQVPEPQAWLLLLAGLPAVVLRRRARRAAPAPRR